MAVSDLPLIAAIGRCVKALDDHDAATSRTAKQLTLRRLSRELRALQRQFHDDSDMPIFLRRQAQ